MIDPVTIWRASCWAYRKKIPILPRLLKTLNFVFFKAILPPEAILGKNVSLAHYGLCVVIHPNVVIHDNVHIHHCVTLATETWVGSEFVIEIYDNVDIGTGAVVVARSNTGLTIGAGAKIGAGAVVTKDVAPGDTVVGAPARPIRR
jgi:serine O-acetyltransferase